MIVAEPEFAKDFDDYAPLRHRMQSIRPVRGNFYNLRECDCKYKDKTSCATQDTSLFVIQDDGRENLVLDTAGHPFLQRPTRSLLTLPDREISGSCEQFLPGFSFQYVFDHPEIGTYYLLNWVGTDYLTSQYLRVHYDNWQLKKYDPKEPDADLIRQMGPFMHVAMAISRERDAQALKAEKAKKPISYDAETGEEIIRDGSKPMN